jgi:hypothetical protein
MLQSTKSFPCNPHLWRLFKHMIFCFQQKAIFFFIVLLPTELKGLFDQADIDRSGVINKRCVSLCHIHSLLLLLLLLLLILTYYYYLLQLLSLHYIILTAVVLSTRGAFLFTIASRKQIN